MVVSCVRKQKNHNGTFDFFTANWREHLSTNDLGSNVVSFKTNLLFGKLATWPAYFFGAFNGFMVPRGRAKGEPSECGYL